MIVKIFFKSFRLDFISAIAIIAADNAMYENKKNMQALRR